MKITIRNIPIGELHPCPNNPYGIREDAELQDSVQQYGVLEPLLVRPLESGGYEIISGHRRRAAAESAGIDKIPARICDLDDSAAMIALVDSNLHREKILPSEKAKAYKLRLDACKKQGVPTDLDTSATRGQVVQKLPDALKVDGLSTAELFVQRALAADVDNSSTKAQPAPMPNNMNGVDRSSTKGQSAPAPSNMNVVDNPSTVRKSRNAIAVNESGRQVQRYVRLMELMPEILQMVDEGKIAFSPAIEISYLPKKEQVDLLETMQSEDRTPSLSQCQRMRKLSAEGRLDMDAIFAVMTEEKANQKETLKFKVDDLRKFFKKNVDTKQMGEIILRLLGEYQRKRERSERERDVR
ncbi:MAG: ParB/RepB/Spo0J family partition protein [Clostridiales bacterium]|nr:ParB/RepB/Spo0J family partition protein [Clostridiales bacterium]